MSKITKLKSKDGETLKNLEIGNYVIYTYYDIHDEEVYGTGIIIGIVYGQSPNNNMYTVIGEENDSECITRVAANLINEAYDSHTDMVDGPRVGFNLR